MDPWRICTTVFANLIYGIKPSPNLDWSAIKKRSLKIAKRLGMSVELTNYHFEDAGYLGVGGVRITRADRQLISLARALVMNPELIVAHKPTSLLDDRQTDNVLDMFKEFTENRGVFMPATEPLVRRRRCAFDHKGVSLAGMSHLSRSYDPGERVRVDGRDTASAAAEAAGERHAQKHT